MKTKQTYQFIKALLESAFRLHFFCLVLYYCLSLFSCIILKNGQIYFKNLALLTLKDFLRVFGHLSTLFMKGLNHLIQTMRTCCKIGATGDNLFVFLSLTSKYRLYHCTKIEVFH